jgi:hypothetical protein
MIHRAPELSFQETQTAAFVAERLRHLGLDVGESIGGTEVVGVLTRGVCSMIGFRADMDALPIREETGVDYPVYASAPCAAARLNTLSAQSGGGNRTVSRSVASRTPIGAWDSEAISSWRALCPLRYRHAQAILARRSALRRPEKCSSWR